MGAYPGHYRNMSWYRHHDKFLILNVGLLSKSRALVLCVAAVLHLLFSIDLGGERVGQTVSDEAVTAAIDLVK